MIITTIVLAKGVPDAKTKCAECEVRLTIMSLLYGRKDVLGSLNWR